MKQFAFGICLFGLLIVQQSNAADDLTDIFARLQRNIEVLHTELENNFLEFRVEMSKQISLISESSLNHIIDGIETVEQQRQRTDDDYASGRNVDCVNSVKTKLDAEIGEIGVQLSQCATIADNSLVLLSLGFFNVLLPAQKNSTEMLNTVLASFIGWNPVNNPEEISTTLAENLAVIEANYRNNVYPDLTEQLEIITNSTSSIPQLVAECVGEAITLFDNKINYAKSVMSSKC